jgi:oligoribonuclease NrnB/cAMP/cGMP phosphodiesterase (DHH superfamily)
LSKTIQIVHIDLDGIAAFILSLHFNIDFDESISVDYTERDLPQNNDILKNYDELFYIDFSPSELNLKSIDPEKCHITIIDHHQSTYDFLTNFIAANPSYHITYIFDNTKCGTELYLDYIENTLKLEIPNCIRKFAEIVGNYDLWKEHLGDVVFENALDLNRLIWKTINYNETGIKKFEFFIRNQLRKFDTNKNNFYLYESEKLKIKEYRNKEVEKLIEAKNHLMIRYDERKNKFGVVSLKNSISIISHYILRERTDIMYLIIINTYDEKNWKISLRSKNFNLLQLKAVEGHEHSAGMVISQKDIRKIYRNIIKSIPYHNALVR